MSYNPNADLAITALTGDVSGTGPGSTATTVNNVGGLSASTIATGAAAANAATSDANTPSTIVTRDGGGNFTANVITATLNGNASTATFATTTGSTTNFSGSLSGDVTGTQTATVVNLVGGKSAAAVASSVTLTQAAASANTPSTLVLRDGSGNFSAGTITATFVGNLTGNASSATSFSGSFSGDVTGTQNATVVSMVGSESAAAVASAVSAVTSATNLNTPSTLVERDSSGNFSAGTITATLTGTATNFSSSLSGDVTGTQSATAVGYVGGQTAAAVATSVNFTSVDLPSTASGSAGSTFIGDDNSYSNFTPTANTVKGALSGIDSALATSSNAITELTGDVTATGPGIVSATVNSVGGSSAAAVAAAAAAVAAATSADTASTLVLRDGSGSISVSNITASTVDTPTVYYPFGPSISVQNGNLIDSSGTTQLSWGTSGVFVPVSLTGSAASAGNLILSSTSNATKGSILIEDGSLLLIGNLTTNTPVFSNLNALQIASDSTVTTNPYAISVLYAGSNASLAPQVNMARAGGSIASPTATQSGYRLSELWSGGYTGSVYTPGAGLVAVAGENWVASSNRGTYLSFYAVPVGSAGLVERLRIDSAGDIQLAPTGTTTNLVWGADGTKGYIGLIGSSRPSSVNAFSGLSVGLSATQLASAIFQADSTTQGLLKPRMTTTQKNAISSPAQGLEVFDTTLSAPAYFDGSVWQQVNAPQSIAANSFLGNNTGSTAAAFALSVIQANTLLAMPVYDAGNSGTTLTIDWTNGPWQQVTLTGNCTVTLTNGVSGVGYVLEFIQGSGPYTVSFSGVLWGNGSAYVASTANTAIDQVNLGYNGLTSSYRGNWTPAYA